MNDAVLSYHANPLTCGVTKFNVQLAERLGVPHREWHYDTQSVAPLISVKCSEVSDADLWNRTYPIYDVFLHDNPTPRAVPFIQMARTIYTANQVITQAVMRMRSAHTFIVPAFCPSTLTGNPTRGEMNVLTFGMAHKQHREQLEKLKAMLDDLHTSYTVSVSCGIHEGSSWSEAWKETDALFRDVFGSHARILGFLADDALAKELQDCSLVALFYDPALRANNTTYWAAIDAGKPVYTLTDEHSPSATDPHSWDALLQVMGVHVSV